MTPLARKLLIVFALLGLGASSAATYVHYNLIHNPDYSSFCDINATVSCKAAYLSQYGSLAGVPVAREIEHVGDRAAHGVGDGHCAIQQQAGRHCTAAPGRRTGRCLPSLQQSAGAVRAEDNFGKQGAFAPQLARLLPPEQQSGRNYGERRAARTCGRQR